MPVEDASYSSHCGSATGHRQHAEKKIGDVWLCRFRDIRADRQTDVQTDILITILRTTPRGEVTNDARIIETNDIIKSVLQMNWSDYCDAVSPRQKAAR